MPIGIRKMKKTINAIILLLIVAAAASPYVAGMMLEKNFNRTVAHLNTIYADQYKFTTEYTRGYAKSTAIIHVVEANNPENKLNLNLNIQHGPVIFEFHGWPNPTTYVPRSYHLAVVTTQLDDKVNKILDGIYAGKPAYAITTLIDFKGNQTTEVKNFPVVVPKDSNEFDWGGMTATVKSDIDLNFITGELNIAKIAYLQGVDNPQTQKQVAAKNIKITFNYGGVATGEHADMAVENISVLEGISPVASVDKLSISVSTLKSGDLFKSDILYSADKIMLEKDQYGPLAVQIKFNNFNAKAIQDFAKKQNADMSMNASLVEMQSILSTSPGVDWDVKFTTPKGKIDFTGSAVVGGKDLKVIDAASVMATADIKLKLNVNQPIVYEFLAQYAEDQLHSKESEFFMQNKDPNIANPYSLSPPDLKNTVEKWIIALLNELKDNKMIIEKDDLISVDAKYLKSQWAINDKLMTDADWKKLQEALIVKVITTPVQPAPDVPGAPIVPGAQSVSAPNSSVTVQQQTAAPVPVQKVYEKDNATQTMEAIQRGKIQVIPAVKGGSDQGAGAKSSNANKQPTQNQTQTQPKPVGKPKPSNALPTPTGPNVSAPVKDPTSQTGSVSNH